MTETQVRPGAGGADPRPAASQYLSCWLGGQHFALPVSAVREIRALGAWSVLPGSPPWVLGVMNLRGLVIPLIDLRVRLGVPSVEHDGPPVMVVVATGSRLAGLVVDGVQEVVELTPGERPGSGSGPSRGPVEGLASAEGRVVVVLNVDVIVDGRQWDVQPASASGPGGAEETEYVELVR